MQAGTDAVVSLSTGIIVVAVDVNQGVSVLLVLAFSYSHTRRCRSDSIRSDHIR